MGSDSEFIGKFSKTWPGGYFEGNPVDPMAPSSYWRFGYNSVLYTVYLVCIRPYITPETTVLEIGPGRGAWTKTIVDRGCKLVYAVDAAPAKHTGFWEYVGVTDRARFIESTDLKLSEVPDNSVNHFFSFGVFCHLKPEMCETYVASLAPKMQKGAHGYLMIADYDKYNYCLDHPEQFSVERFLSSAKVLIPARIGFGLMQTLLPSRFNARHISKTDSPETTRDQSKTEWYHWGLDRACEALRREGFQIVERDAEIVARDPVIHFIKP